MRTGIIAGLLALACAPGAAAQEKQPDQRAPRSVAMGINLSGGEFRSVERRALLPDPADLRAYYDAGFRVFRIPFKMTQVRTAPAKLRLLGSTCLALNVPCIFDRHEYDWRKVPPSVPEWLAFLKLMPASDLIQIDPMNELKFFDSKKVKKDWDQWAQEGQQWVTDMRSAGITNQLWLEYPGVTAAFRFDKGERKGKACLSAACALRKLPGGTIVDPLGKTGLQAHRYPDKNSSGANDYCYPYTSIGTFARQARPFGLPVMVGEIAFGSDRGMRDSCRGFGAAVIAEMLEAENLAYVTWWGGGRGWKKSYLFRTPASPTLPYVRMITGK
ncbi:cellulase family glycosylhydrolase [Sphingomonas aerophila]|uniref:Glycoside hydrolase family 5 domain-containing protein n=1 Tax=Sphingomonas aerophila TaxID=1344948 RepID=A0A7W9EU07_9SPHN|nr:cellulase family glycosylhydrolase [Sphingomonas aerophila]MBB5714769.1 hypothetical protein [Sphingomonas aerophila]